MASDAAGSSGAIHLSELMMPDLENMDNNTGNKLQADRLQTKTEKSSATEREASAKSTLQAGVETILHTDIATIDVSRREAVVNLEEESFIKREFAVGGDMIYVVGKSADGSVFFADMSAEDRVFHYFTVEMPENMQVFHMTVRSDQPEEDGIARLQWEIISGKGPDLIDFGREYATSDIVGRYTVDLKPYLSESGYYEEAEYFTNVWDAFAYKESLYALPVSFTLQTFAGSREALEGRGQWNIEEMIACYEAQPTERSLYPGQTKKDVFGTILTGSMDCYIDWEQGKCSFDGADFLKVMSFANTFPDRLVIAEDYSVKQTFYEGGALLLPLHMSSIYDICKAEFIFGEEEISYIGFPVESACGTVVKPSEIMLGISANSAHKDAAWVVYTAVFEGFLSEGD